MPRCAIYLKLRLSTLKVLESKIETDHDWCPSEMCYASCLLVWRIWYVDSDTLEFNIRCIKDLVRRFGIQNIEDLETENGTQTFCDNAMSVSCEEPKITRCRKNI